MYKAITIINTFSTVQENFRWASNKKNNSQQLIFRDIQQLKKTSYIYENVFIRR